MKEVEAMLEAVLFAAGEPVSEEKLQKVSELPREELKKTLQEMQDQYDREGRGICLIRLEDCWQLCTRSVYASFIRRMTENKKPPSLSQAALEVLTIIAYKQPVTRAYIDQIRGVDSSYTVSMLLDKGLIIQDGHMDVPGHPSLLKTTEVFLRTFHLSSLSELPLLPEFSEKLSKDTESPEEKT